MEFEVEVEVEVGSFFQTNITRLGQTVCLQGLRSE